MRPLTKAWKLVATGRCSGHLQHSPLTCTDSRCTSPGLGASTGHSPLARRLKDVPDRPPPRQFPGTAGGSSCKVLFSLFSVSVTFHRNCPTSLLPQAQRPLCGLQTDGTLGGHCLERSSLPPAPDPTLSPAPPQNVSLELPQEASSGLLPTQMKMVLSTTHPRTTLSSEQN